MSIVGYARVSSVGQSLDVQREKLIHCDKIFEEKKSGTTGAEHRPALRECLRYVREGDKLVVSRLDRIARSCYHLTQIAEELRQKGVELVVLDQNIDTSTSTGKLLFNLLSSIAEFESELRKERQTDGIILAQKRGVKFGAKPKLTDTQVEEMRLKRASGVLIRDLMKDYGISKASVYRLLATIPAK